MRDIVVFGDPVLTKKAQMVTTFDADLTSLVAEMHQIMIKAHGVGLAAPQIGLSLAICIVDTTVGEDPDQLVILINPQVLEASGIQKDEEGCLSFPDITTVVERPESVKIRAQNLAGSWIEMQAEGFLARAILHEIDHLNGVLMTDRVSKLKREIIKKKVVKRQKAGTWHT